MTIHYHGTPISPRSTLLLLKGFSFCVSYLDRRDVGVCHAIGQHVMLDNGAFSVWRRGVAVDWTGYYDWASEWFSAKRSTWAVVPDVIEGDADANDELLRQWPHGRVRGAPVWHMHEPISRFLRLADGWERVCVGSSAQYSNVGSAPWRRRMTEAFNSLAPNGVVPVRIHMLRGLKMAGSEFPFHSVDSANIARNHKTPPNDALKMAEKWATRHNPVRWERSTKGEDR